MDRRHRRPDRGVGPGREHDDGRVQPPPQPGQHVDAGHIRQAEVEDHDIGPVFGGGVELSRFIIEGRYSKGLRTVNTHFNTNDFKINSFAALLGIRFH